MPKLPELPAVSKIEEGVAFLLSKEEAGFKPWWEQQLERRARVAETCDRSLFPGISGFNSSRLTETFQGVFERGGSNLSFPL